MKLQKILSRKHPGAVFLKVAETKDGFVAKFYPGNEVAAELFQAYAATPEFQEAFDRATWNQGGEVRTTSSPAAVQVRGQRHVVDFSVIDVTNELGAWES